MTGWQGSLPLNWAVEADSPACIHAIRQIGGPAIAALSYPLASAKLLNLYQIAHDNSMTWSKLYCHQSIPIAYLFWSRLPLVIDLWPCKLTGEEPRLNCARILLHPAWQTETAAGHLMSFAIPCLIIQRAWWVYFTHGYTAWFRLHSISLKVAEARNVVVPC